MVNGNTALKIEDRSPNIADANLAAPTGGLSEADRAERDIVGWLTRTVAPSQAQTAALTEMSGLAVIRTPRGERSLNELQAGDEIETFDDGPLRIRELTHVDAPRQRPVVIRSGLLGATNDVAFGPRRRLFFRGGAADLLFGAPDILMEARDLPAACGARRGDWSDVGGAIALTLERPSLIWADGVITETGDAPVFAATRPVLKPMETAALVKFTSRR